VPANDGLDFCFSSCFSIVIGKREIFLQKIFIIASKFTCNFVLLLALIRKIQKFLFLEKKKRERVYLLRFRDISNFYSDSPLFHLFHVVEREMTVIPTSLSVSPSSSTTNGEDAHGIRATDEGAAAQA